MRRALATLVAAIALLAIGFAVGWNEKGAHVAAAETHQARDQVHDITQQVQQQAADLQHRLEHEQAASLELLIAQRAARAAGAAIRLEIRYATFTSPSPGCPAPLDSPEFYRLYNAAAAGAVGPAPAGSTARSGVHPPGL